MKSKESLIEEIRDFVLKEGRYPTKKDCKENPDLSGSTTYRRFFGFSECLGTV